MALSDLDKHVTAWIHPMLTAAHVNALNTAFYTVDNFIWHVEALHARESPSKASNATLMSPPNINNRIDWARVSSKMTTVSFLSWQLLFSSRFWFFNIIISRCSFRPCLTYNSHNHKTSLPRICPAAEPEDLPVLWVLFLIRLIQKGYMSTILYSLFSLY